MIGRGVGALLLATTTLASGSAMAQMVQSVVAPQADPSQTAQAAPAAQTPSNQAPAAQSTTQGSATQGSATQLPAISVTGTLPPDSLRTPDYSASPKFTAPLLDTPKTVTVINSEVMQQTGVNNLADALRTTPGITMGMGEGGTPFGDLPFIRGFNATNDIFVDGVRDPGSQSRETFNVEQIEITKGPGGAYSGTGATGGSVNIISKAPKAENFYAGSVVVGTDWTKRVTGDVNQKISDNAAFRINAMYHDAEVAGRDAVTLNRWGIAPSLTIGMRSDTKATLSYYHMQTDDLPDYGIPYGRYLIGNTRIPTGKPAVVDPNNYYGLTNRDFRKTQADIGTLLIEHQFTDHLKLTNTTRYSESKNNYIATNPDDSRGNVAYGQLYRSSKSRNSHTTAEANQTNLQGDFNTSFIKHNYVVGMEFSRAETTNQNYVVGVGSLSSGLCPTTGAATNYNCTSLYNPNPDDPWTGSIAPSGTITTTKTKTKSAYVFDTIEFTPEWSVNLGLRGDSYDTEATGVNGGNSSSFVNYQGGLVYKPLPNGSIYIAYGTSSNPSGESGGDGSISTLASATPATNNINLEPEQNKSYELGTKWNVFDNKLQVTAAIFRTEKTNARAVDAGGNLSLIGNQQVDGFELGLSGNITDKWKVFGGYSYLDAQVKDDGPNARNDGKKFPSVPTNSGTLFTTYEIFDKTTVGGTATYVSKVYGDAANTLSIPSYWRFDTMASYKVTENVNVQLNVNNIFDKRYFDRAFTTHMATVAPGRVALLSTNFKF